MHLRVVGNDSIQPRHAGHRTPSVPSSRSRCHALELGGRDLLALCSHGRQPGRTGRTQRWQGTGAAIAEFVGGMVDEGCSLILDSQSVSSLRYAYHGLFFLPLWLGVDQGCFLLNERLRTKGWTC